MIVPLLITCDRGRLFAGLGKGAEARAAHADITDTRMLTSACCHVQAALQEIRKAQKPHRMAIVPVDEGEGDEEDAEDQYHAVRPVAACTLCG